MNKNTASLALAAALASFAHVSAPAVEVDGVAAQVGDITILRSDVEAAMRRAGAMGGETDFNKVRSDLIDRTLILKAAGKAKMTMQEWVVDDRVKTIINEAFGGDRNRLIEELSRERLPYPDWRRKIKEDLIVGAMRWNFVNKNVKVSPSAMQSEYKAHPERYLAGESVTVGVILLDPERAGEKDAVRDMIRTNSFAAAARTFSVDTHAKDGGIWKDVNPKEVFKEEVCEELSKMPVGTVSDWVEISGWSFLLKKESEKTARQKSFAEAYEDIDREVRSAEAKRLYSEWMERLRAETYIKTY